MQKYFKIFFLVSIIIIFSKCSKDDEAISSPIVLNDFDVQYAVDTKIITDYLKTHKITFNADMDPTYEVVTKLDPSSVWGSNDLVHNSSLLERVVFNSDKTKSYIIYYLQPRKGSGDQPCSVDEIRCTYEGRVFPADNTEVSVDYTVFDKTINKQTAFNLLGRTSKSAIEGFAQIFPQFQSSAPTTTNSDGSINYADFGAGIMFVPSGFAYFNQVQTKIPAYSPLIFSFKLFNVVRLDQDFDGILSNDEDLNRDHYITLADDDTDKDGIVDAFDFDDDGDNVLTNTEIRRPNLNAFGRYTFYPYNGSTIDDPTTTDINETQGVPDCSGNFDNPARKRKYLDNSCQ